MSQFRSWQEWAELDEGREPFLIDGLVHASATIFSGRPMAGKTTIAAAAVAAIAGDHQELFGQAVNLHGPVLVIATDPGEGYAWGRRMTSACPRHPVLIASYDMHRTWDATQRVIDEVAPVLLVFDNVLGAVEGDIRDSATAQELLSRFRPINDANVAVLAVAHSSARQFEDGTQAKGPMGSTAYDAWDRLTVHVEKTGAKTMKLTVASNEWAPYDLVIDHDMDRAGPDQLQLVSTSLKKDKRARSVETREARRSFVRDRILGDPEADSHSTQDSLAKHLGVSKSRVQRSLKQESCVHDGERWVIEGG